VSGLAPPGHRDFGRGSAVVTQHELVPCEPAAVKESQT
jgi:hypothetical protein